LRARSVTANGLQFGLLEAGSGPLALCLHGFPDSAHTWRHLLPALADAGFHAVAPFMRGYAPTDVPADGCFQLGALVADAVGLHDVLGGDERAVLIGNDWGAETAYGAGAFAPDRWRRVVTLAVPPLALDTKIFSDYDQLKRFFYLFFLKTPFAEPVLAAADDMAFLDRLWQDWSPGYDAGEDLDNVKQCLRDERNLAAAIGYYRSEEPGSTPPLRITPTRLNRRRWPALRRSRPCTSYRSRDGCIDLALVKDAERHLAPGSRMEVLEDAGHFLQVEKPAAVNARILAWVGA
jgi:pimeloyl-ACP methyl ester carboxylesterase